MIDTVRVKISLPDNIKDLLIKSCTRRVYADKKGDLQSVLHGDIVIPLTKAKLNYFFDQRRQNTIYLEGSYPKVWYGDNVHLLYPSQLEPVLKIIHSALSRMYGYFPEYASWVFQRIDTTYAWKYESEEKAIEVIDYMKRLELPRNSIHIYPPSETVTFGSRKSRTITFYRKNPEFKKKGLPELLARGLADNALECSQLSVGVVRFEVENKVEHLHTYFGTDTPITFDMFQDEKIIPDIITKALQKLQGDIDLKGTHDLALFKSLRAIYKANRASRLFCFYKTYYSRLKTRQLIHKYGLSGDIADDIKALKEANIILPTYLSTSHIDLSIPSPLVVNLPPSSEALATELDKHLISINEQIKFVEDGVQTEIGL